METNKKNALLVGSSEECAIWGFVLRKANSNFNIVTAASETEAGIVLYDSFMQGVSFDLVITNEFSRKLIQRTDIKDQLIVIWKGELEVRMHNSRNVCHGDPNRLIKSVYSSYPYT